MNSHTRKVSKSGIDSDGGKCRASVGRELDGALNFPFDLHSHGFCAVEKE
jgi:hypothetical protein